MSNTVPEHERFTLGSRVMSVAIATTLLVAFGAPLAGQVSCSARASLAVGHVSGVAGQTVKVPLIGRSACDVQGFALAVGHSVERLEFVRVDPGRFLVDYAGNQLFVLSDFSNVLGYATFVVAFDFTAPVTVLPRGIPSHTELLELTYRVKPGAPRGVTQLINQDRRYGFPPVNHIYSSPRGQINPQLSNGSVTIQAFSVSAGADRRLPEGSFTTLTGSANGFRFGASPTYRWTQTSGPLTQKIAGGASASLTVQLPQVTGDQIVVFELEVDDGQDISRDTVEIVVQDSDARGGDLRKTPTPSNVDLPPSSQAIAFVGQIEWATDFEDGIWTAVRFQVNSHTVLDEIARARLYVDENESGDLDAGDRLLGTVNSPFTGGVTTLSFAMNERLKAGDPVQFLLVVERDAPAPARQGSLPVWPALLVLGTVVVLRRAGGDLGLAAGAGRCLGWMGVALFLALLAPACSGGGGGGGFDGDGGGGHPSGVVFSIEDEADIDLRGETTGLVGSITGLPIDGPALNVK